MKKIALTSLLAIVGNAHAAPVFFPNGDFETAAGAEWSFDQPEPPDNLAVDSYPSTGGNPDGHAVIDDSAGAPYAVLVSNDGMISSLDSLGLESGKAYNFSLDMKIVSGSTLGGFKIDFFAADAGAGSTGDIYPDAIGDGSAWETYTFEISIPAGVDGLKAVPLWGPGSSVAYDNVIVDDTPLEVDAITQIPNSGFEEGNADWTEAGAPNTTFSYPSSGGNPGGYGVMTNDGGGYGVLVANNGAIMPMDDLGLEAGKTYIFKQDMTILSGSNIGGMKVEFYAGAAGLGNTGDTYLPLQGDGSTWETYEFAVTIPQGADGIKVVPLWGSGSSVGYDNVLIVNTPVVPPPVIPIIPNGDFEIPDGADWFFEDVGGTGQTDEYPISGGNPGGFAVIDSVGKEGEAWLTSNNNAPLSLADLGLTPGETYTILMDMKILEGSNIGGLKAEFAPTGTGPIFPSLIGDGSTWETYEFEITIPPLATLIFIQPLRGEDSEVGYDNVRFELTTPEAFVANTALGTLVSWDATSAEEIYQPQQSNDGATWVDLGPPILGDAVSSVFDAEESPFYQVEVMSVMATDAVLNGGFEIPSDFDPLCPDKWVCLDPTSNDGRNLPTRITTDFRSSPASLQLKVQNEETEMANQSEINQNILNQGGEITPGNSYDFSFWAKQISEGVSYVQEYSVQWLGESGAIVGESGFIGFRGGADTWAEISLSGLVAPESATSAYIQIIGKTGAVPSLDAKGEVLIDDVFLVTSTSSVTGVIPATTGDGIEISWQSEVGREYQVETSPGLANWQDFGPLITGDGGVQAVSDLITPEAKFYQVVETP